jgi:CRP/FNR family cyclic AMP-dependent transcriptional regulator
MFRISDQITFDEQMPRPGSGSCSTRYPRSGRKEDLDSSDLKRFEKGDVIFIEGDRPRGVYNLRQGRVKLTTSTPDGRVLILGVALPGDTLGLSAVVSRSDYEATAEAIEPIIVQFIAGDVFLSRLRRNADFALEAALELSRRYREAHAAMGSLASTDPVLIRLARLFMKWAFELRDIGNGDGHRKHGHNPIQLRNSFTHQQIAEMIGSSRETVTRVLREMRERDLVTLKGADLRIHSPAKLAMVAAGEMDQFCDARHEALVF